MRYLKYLLAWLPIITEALQKCLSFVKTKHTPKVEDPAVLLKHDSTDKVGS